MQAIREWLSGLWVYIQLLNPLTQEKVLESAYQMGREDGKYEGWDACCSALANMNRDDRRKAVRQIVQRYNLNPPVDKS